MSGDFRTLNWLATQVACRMAVIGIGWTLHHQCRSAQPDANLKIYKERPMTSNLTSLVTGANRGLAAAEGASSADRG